MPTPAAIVLAAGQSRRMGRPKAWLRLGGEALVTRAARIALAGGAQPVVVVGGLASEPTTADPERLAAQLGTLWPTDVVLVVPGAPRGDALASLRCGLALVPAGSPLLVWPVDCPFADAELVRQLLALVLEWPGIIAVPEHDGRRGHPVAFGAQVVPELAQDSLAEGARSVVARDPARVKLVLCDDPRVCEDIDTPDDAMRLGLELEGRT